jgi:hypothetical protein
MPPRTRKSRRYGWLELSVVDGLSEVLDEAELLGEAES